MKTAEELNKMTSEEFRNYLRNTEEGKRLLSQARKISSENKKENIKLPKKKSKMIYKIKNKILDWWMEEET